jgi:hypothetical protein
MVSASQRCCCEREHTAHAPLTTGWPSYGLWFKAGVDWAPHLARLQNTSATAPFKVYTHESMPERWHFRHAAHVAPVYVVPAVGWVISHKVSRASPGSY